MTRLISFIIPLQRILPIQILYYAFWDYHYYDGIHSSIFLHNRSKETKRNIGCVECCSFIERDDNRMVLLCLLWYIHWKDIEIEYKHYYWLPLMLPLWQLLVSIQEWLSAQVPEVFLAMAMLLIVWHQYWHWDGLKPSPPK